MAQREAGQAIEKGRLAIPRQGEVAECGQEKRRDQKAGPPEIQAARASAATGTVFQTDRRPLVGRSVIGR